MASLLLALMHCALPLQRLPRLVGILNLTLNVLKVIVIFATNYGTLRALYS